MALCIAGLVLIIIGGACLWGRSVSLAKAGKLKSIKQSTIGDVLAGRCSGVVAVRGEVSCEAPLSSEISQTRCVHYRMRVERETEETYREYNEQEKREEQKTRRNRTTVSSNERRCPFTVSDSTGSVRVHPDRAEMDAEQVLSRFEPERGGLTFQLGAFSLNLGGVAMAPGGHRTIGYHFEEHALPVGRTVFVTAEARPEGGGLSLQAPSDRSFPFLVSLKSQEETIRSKETAAKILLVLAGVLMAGGLVLTLVGLLKV